MSLANVSLFQALDVWDELVMAYHENNGYGGDTAEIYIYRLMEHHPAIALANKDGAPDFAVETATESYQKATAALHELMCLFMKSWNCAISIMETREKGYEVSVGHEFRELMVKDPITHRVHIRVTACE